MDVLTSERDSYAVIFLFRVHKNRFDRLQDDRPVQDRRTVLQIVNVILQFFGNIRVGEVGAVIDLRPSGDAGLDKEPRLIVRDPRRELCHELRPFRPRADERKIAADDIPELGQFVEV